jgi:hypothetical protein
METRTNYPSKYNSNDQLFSTPVTEKPARTMASMSKYGSQTPYVLHKVVIMLLLIGAKLNSDYFTDQSLIWHLLFCPFRQRSWPLVLILLPRTAHLAVTPMYSIAARFHEAIWRERSFKAYVRNETNMEKSVIRLTRGSGVGVKCDEGRRSCFTVVVPLTCAGQIGQDSWARKVTYPSR